MAKHEIILPSMGEGIFEATIVKWLKQKGDQISVDESIVEIATDKVDTEIPVSTEGILTEIIYDEGVMVKVGSVIAIIDDQKESTNDVSVFAQINSSSNNDEPEEIIEEQEISAETIITKNSDSNKYFSPLVKEILKKEKLTTAEIDNIKGTAMGGRITKNDITNYLNNRNTLIANTIEIKEDVKIEPEKHSIETVPLEIEIKKHENIEPEKHSIEATHLQKEEKIIHPTENNHDRVIEMDRIRKLIAENMVKSKQTAPHVTSFAEADVTNLVKWREKIKNLILEKYGLKITYTPIFIQAIANAIKAFPMVNVSIEGNNIIIKNDINIGMATALPDGNLIVPVIKNANEKNILGITKAVNDLSERARNGKLTLAEIQGGTFSLTNLGTFGSLIGTPIILQPQSAILATGIIKKRVVVIENPDGDMIGIRNMIMLAMSYDHRIIDGALAGNFLNKIVEYLENFDTSLEL
ncbi:MAG: hypothetical protein A2X02_07520 [Bacteroidetes bacterium GWF2_29_10]|nr:MAG: hypothetical protein A2X02_07520 [Bacteroidetes bacterium GWF2_29_10]